MCEWKSVKNELPNNKENVLVVCSDEVVEYSKKLYKHGLNKICIMKFEKKSQLGVYANEKGKEERIQTKSLFVDLIGGLSWSLNDIIYWMPLPETPNC